MTKQICLLATAQHLLTLVREHPDWKGRGATGAAWKRIWLKWRKAPLGGSWEEEIWFGPVQFLHHRRIWKRFLAVLDFLFSLPEAVKFPDLWKTQVLTQVFRSARNLWSSKMKSLWLFTGFVCDARHIQGMHHMHLGAERWSPGNGSGFVCM